MDINDILADLKRLEDLQTRFDNIEHKPKEISLPSAESLRQSAELEKERIEIERQIKELREQIALEKELDFETVKENLKYRNAGGW